MAVKPTGVAAGGVEVWHEEFNHGGVVPWADVDFAKGHGGAEHRGAIYLPCPVAGCDSASWHPVTGGAERKGVRELFARHYLRQAQRLGLTEVTTIEEARAYVRERAREAGDDREDEA